MGWIHDTIADFGRQLGVEGLDFGLHGVLRMDLPGGGFIAVEPACRGEVEEVLVYVGRTAGHQAGSLLTGALAKAHYLQGGPLPVQVGLLGAGPEAQLVVLARLPERAFTVQSLNHAVDFLGRWLDELAAGKTR